MIVYASTVIQQVLIMLLLMAVGYLLCRRGMINENCSAQISVILMKIVAPLLVVNACQRTFDSETGRLLGMSFLVAASALGLAILFGILFYRRKGELWRENRLSMVFTNNGFMAFPLLQALFGDLGLFLGAAHVSLGVVLLWSYGAWMMVGKDFRFNLKSILLNPGIISMVLGILLFLSPVKIPGLLFTVMGHIGNLNTPLAMLLLGAYLARTDLLSCFRNKGLLLLCLKKMVIFPLVLIGALAALRIQPTVAAVVLVASVCPAAVSLPMMAQLYGRDYAYFSKVVAVTTLASIVTIPLMLTLLQVLQGAA